MISVWVTQSESDWRDSASLIFGADCWGRESPIGESERVRLVMQTDSSQCGEDGPNDSD